MTPSRTYGAVVFDMDGVLADSEPVYFASINAVLRGYGGEITDEQHRTQMGHGVNDSVRAFLEMSGVDAEIEVVIRAYSSEVVERLSRLSTPLPGVIETVRRLKQLGTPLALASSSQPSWIDALVGGLGLQGQFDVVVSGAHVAHAKPAPDIYLEAARLLNIAPQLCIAIEDTPAGVASAQAAGMFAVQVRSASTAFPPLADADLVLGSLEAFDTGLVAAK